MSISYCNRAVLATLLPVDMERLSNHYAVDTLTAKGRFRDQRTGDA